jgi:flagellar basal-body rod modification protein FlgD
MATIGAVPTTLPPVAAAVTDPTASKTTSAQTLAANFTQFLQLLTTQLKNQNPLDPLDTNQFTQQLVQFAQVEQQLKSNTQLETLVNLEKSAQSSVALGFVGNRVAVDGATAKLENGEAIWSFNSPKPVSATMSIKNEAGQVVFSKNFTVESGAQQFSWDGKDTNGIAWPDGNYTLSVAAQDASGQSVAIPTEVEGVVDSVDLSKTPPLLSIGGKTFTVDKIKRVIRFNA